MYFPECFAFCTMFSLMTCNGVCEMTRNVIIMKVTNKMQLYRLIYYFQSALHVSGDVFAHHQEQLIVFTVSGSIRLSCCGLGSWMSFNSSKTLIYLFRLLSYCLLQGGIKGLTTEAKGHVYPKWYHNYLCKMDREKKARSQG